MDLNGLRPLEQTLVTRGVAQGPVAIDKTVNVNFLGTTIRCRAVRGLSTAAGDVVLAVRSGRELVVMERLHAAAPGADPNASFFPPNPWASVQTGTSVFHPIETRSYRDTGGWRKDTDDTFQGDWGGNRHKGCAFYGNGPRSLFGAEVMSAYVKVKRQLDSTWSPYEATTLKRFTEKRRPTNFPPTDVNFLSGSATGPRLRRGESQNFVIPTLYAQELVDGTAGGLAIHQNLADAPKARLEGRASWAPAWTLVVNWRRVI